MQTQNQPKKKNKKKPSSHEITETENLWKDTIYTNLYMQQNKDTTEHWNHCKIKELEKEN